MNIIEDMKAALAAATQGEWRHRPPSKGGARGHEIYVPDDYFGDLICMMSHHPAEREQQGANALLIALMHNNLPALIECVEALENLVICPAFNGQVFERDKESHREWTLARAALAKLKESKS